MRDKNIHPIAPSSRCYFENGMYGHNAVQGITAEDEHVYRINRSFGRADVRVYVADIYIAGEADILEICRNNKGIDCIVLIGFLIDTPKVLNQWLGQWESDCLISESFMALLTIQVKDLLIMKSKMKTKVRIPQCNYLRCYAFGSVVYSDNPSDIDIVIIYDKTRMSIDDAIQYRHQLEQELSMVFDKNIDTLLLSKEEEIEMEFLENAKTIPLN